MRIVAEQIAVQFLKQTVFHKFSYSFESGKPYAVTGPNGSGKSTLLQVLCGYLQPTEGEVLYVGSQNNKVNPEHIFKYLSVCAPYMELPEELTLKEVVKFHHAMKPLCVSADELIAILDFETYCDKAVFYFSSGMKQKLKLGLTFYSDVSMLFLDEPGSNLDKSNFHWYKEEVKKVIDQKLVIIFSNNPEEYDLCEKIIQISDFK